MSKWVKENSNSSPYSIPVVERVCIKNVGTHDKSFQSLSKWNHLHHKFKNKTKKSKIVVSCHSKKTFYCFQIFDLQYCFSGKKK